MKVGDLVVSKAYQNYAEFVPAKLVVQKTTKLGHAKGPFVVLADEPDEWQSARKFFVVSPA